MEKINRAIVKAQAREILKGKWIYLAIVSLITIALTSSSLSLSLDNRSLKNILNYNYRNTGFIQDIDKSADADDEISDFENFGNDGNLSEDDDLSDFENFGNYNFDNDNNYFGFDMDDFIGGADEKQYNNPSIFDRIRSTVSAPLDLVNLIFAPLTVTLAGIYLALVRKPNEEFQLGKELGGLFQNSFNETYVKKLVVVILRYLFTTLLCFLFIIPGIVYFYSTYFAYQIMCDNPDLKPTEALKLSKKMVKGNRGELFVLNLSFIGWILLVTITFGIASIYVTPYIMTTDALYYENFRMRALQYGRISEADFGATVQANDTYNNEPQQDSYFSYATPENDNAGYYYNPTQVNDINEYQAPSYTEPTTDKNDYYTPEPPTDITSDSSQYYSPTDENQE